MLRYVCHRQILGGDRVKSSSLWVEYTIGKQTYSQLASKYKCSIKTIPRKLDKYQVVETEIGLHHVIALMDSTYWGKGFRVMLFKDAITKDNLLKYYVKTETKQLYQKSVDELKAKGFKILGIVCDGGKGLFQSFKVIPVQMCQFYQSAIIRRCSTKRPKLQAGMDLIAVLDLMKRTDKESFEAALNQWQNKWNKFLNERTINEATGRSF